ncbi:MAG: peptidase S58 family protein, partial [Acidimicrobiia bacterium]|nr:peptidase S58 family protein [Acidimicrobiia bacterium]
VDALSPRGSVQECHGIVLTGGSAFGLATADGVVSWCEGEGLGLALPLVTVPIVAAAVVFDIRDPYHPRPGAEAGAAACRAAAEEDPPQGSVGVGAGCTAAKVAGREWAVAGGQGWAVTRGGGVTVGAIMGVNPVGEVLGPAGEVLAGTRAPAEAPRFPEHSMAQIAAWGEPPTAGTNTVIGCVVTDAKLTKVEACRAADLAHSGIARAVRPAHTSADGDIIFLLATGAEGHEPSSVDLVAELASKAVADAIRSAVAHATGSEQFPPDPRAKDYLGA